MFDDADFSPLVPDQTARFDLTELHIPRGNPAHVVLLVKHAGEGNTGFANGIKNAKFRTLSDDAADKAYDALAARYVIVGWESVNFKDGKPLAYTPGGGAELLAKLREVKRSSLIARLVAFASDPTNFTAPVVDPGDLGNE